MVALHASFGSAIGGLVATPLRARVPLALVVLALVTVLLTGIVIAVGSRFTDESDDEFETVRETFGPMESATVDEEATTVTLADGTTLDREEAAAVAAVYEYFDRRPGATADEIRRRVYPRATGGYEDAGAWWSDLVEPALQAHARAVDPDDELDDRGAVAKDTSPDRT